MARFAAVPLFAVAACLVARVEADAFLHKLDVEMESVSVGAVEQTLMAELALIGRDDHLQGLQNELQPMYQALPKNAAGKLDAPVVRYALHRFFSQARGWHVQGLQPSGESRNSTVPVKIMKDRVPSFIQGILERRVNGQGLALEELAAFAATVQDLVHAEAVENLRAVQTALFSEHNEGEWGDSDVEKMADVYLMHYIIGGEITTNRLKRVQRNVQEIYPAWPEVAMWARDLRQTLRHRWESRHNPFAPASLGFHEVADFVREAGYRFGSFQDQECRVMKDTLVEMEYRGTGRVRLSEFYKGGLEGNWQFAESVDYLRAMGALDESIPEMPSVLIANYVGSQSNCVASSSFYSVCCLDECEGLLAKLESAVGAPMAEPKQIAALMAAMPSDTVDAPRNLSSSVLARLDQIALHHGGRVPLHGRLFSQLMHNAYPRECPYPHVAGTTNPMTPDAWMAKKGSVAASAADMQLHVTAGKNATGKVLADQLDLPWTHIEELVAIESLAVEGRGSFLGLASKVLLLLAFAGVVAPTVGQFCTKVKAAQPAESKYLV